jgi:hypothetical protein
MNNNKAFELGYLHGKETGQSASYADALRLYPDMNDSQCQSFCEGTEDGRIGDTFRLNVINAFESLNKA